LSKIKGFRTIDFPFSKNGNAGVISMGTGAASREVPRAFVRQVTPTAGGAFCYILASAAGAERRAVFDAS